MDLLHVVWNRKFLNLVLWLTYKKSFISFSCAQFTCTTSEAPVPFSAMALTKALLEHPSESQAKASGLTRCWCFGAGLKQAHRGGSDLDGGSFSGGEVILQRVQQELPESWRASGVGWLRSMDVAGWSRCSQVAWSLGNFVLLIYLQ